MAIQLKDRILTLCTTVGTNDAIVGATKESYQGWEGITYGNTVYYCITDDINWEVGYGSYLDRAGTPTIQRNVLSSSNGNEKLELSGNASIFCTYPSEKSVILNADDNMYYPSSNINANKFVGDGSLLTNLPNDNVWKDNGSSIEYKGNGATTTQVWAENNGKYAKVIQKNDGTAYFKGDGATFFGTDSELPVNIFVDGQNQLAVGKDSVYSFQPVTAPEFIGNGAKITNIDAELNSLAPEAPTDGETYARNNKTWVSISESAGIPDAPVNGLMYGRQDGEWGLVADADDIYTKTETNTLLDEKADKSTTYTKDEVDVIDNAQDAKIVINNDEIARQQIEITNNSASIIKNDGDINKNILDIATNTGNIATNTAEIASNASSIGTLSVQVNNNSQDIEALQEGIFFSSSYSADYPATANRDPETGNMYMQATGVFTFSYATCNQIFLSKTDEQGNTRQFTAIQAGDSLVLNEVESPNYGRYELVSVDDAGDYVVLLVNNKDAQGSLLAGAKVAFQAFPASGVEVDAYTKAESDAIDDAQDVNISANTTAITTKIDEAPIDGKEYARKDANWTEVTGGGGETQPAVTMSAGITATSSIPSSAWVPVVVNDTEYDTNDCLDTATGKYTPNVEGYYLVNVSAKIGGTGLVRGLSAIALNNARVIQGSEAYNSADPSEGITSTATSIVYCNGTTDYIQMQVLANGSTGSNSLLVGLGTQFNVSLITGQSTGGSGGGAPSVDTAIGMVAPFAMDSVPTGWLHCDGSAVSRTTYSSLYSKVADLYGAGDGSTTFNLPNLQDEFVRGSSDTLAVGTKQDDALQNIEGEIYNGNTGVQGGGATGAFKVISSSSSLYRQQLEESSGAKFNFDASRVVRTADETRPRNVAMLYCINATAEPSSGGGTTDILPVLYSGRLTQDGTTLSGTGFSATLSATNKYTVTFDTPLPNNNYSVTATVNSSGARVVTTRDKLETGFVMTGWNGDTPTPLAIDFTVTGTETIAVGGGSGSYTPEAMVWEDKLSERAEGIEYTNDTGRLLDVSVISKGGVGFSSQLLVNDIPIAFFTYNTANHSNTVNAIVPVGATYKFNSAGGTSDITSWQEAEMPLAVGTGGETVAFRGSLSANQTGLTTQTWTKINLNTTSIDTENALVDGKFKPSVAGYYQVNGNVRERCTPASIVTVASIYKNGSLVSIGNYGLMDASTAGSVSDIFYLDGKDDYLELFGQVNSTGTCGIESASKDTYLSAVLVSGGSGDSIVTQEGTEVTVGDDDVTKTTLKGEVIIEDNIISSNQLEFQTDGTERMKISPSGSVTVGGALTCANLTTPGFPTTGSDPSYAPNMYISDDGAVFKSGAVTTYMSKEEVAEQLAIKDTLIEKLSARLDELEKKVN